MPFAPKSRGPSNYGQARKEYESRRHSAAERGYGTRWTKYKSLMLSKMVVTDANAYCRYCDRNEAETLDHGIPPTRMFSVGSDEYWKLFWDRAYHIPCCIKCNSVKQDRMPHELPDWMRQRLEAVLKSRGVNWKDSVRS